jgi:oligopeptide transport system substrate-binding protein
LPVPSQHRSHSLPRNLRLVAVAMALVSMLTGCWPLANESSPPPTRITVSGTPLASPFAGLATGGAVNITIGVGEPPTLDPALATDPYSLSIIRQLFSALVTFDGELKIVPDVASSLPSVSGDGKTYTFPLRRGVRFTNGQEVTSADFKYSLERATSPTLAGPHPASSLPAALYLGDVVGVKEKLAGTAREISGVVAPDPYTLAITIDAPKSYFLAKLAAGPTFVVQRSNVESGEAWTEDPRGTGPYKLQKWERNQYMTLARNTDYFGGVPDVPIINIMMKPGQMATVDSYIQEGGRDIAVVSVEEIERASDRNSPLARELQSAPNLSLTYLGFNTRQKPFDDPKVREAIARAIDRQKLSRALFQSRVQEAIGFVLPGHSGYKPSEQAQLFNVTRARQLIVESTYKDVRNLPRLRLFTTGEAVGPMLSEALSQTLGLDVEVREVEWTEFAAGLERGDYPMFLGRADAPYPDPEATLGPLFRPSSPANYTGYRNTDVEALLNAASSESDAGKRLSTYAQVEGHALSDFIALPLYRPVSYTLVKPHIRGVTLTPLGMLSLRNLKVVGR